MEHRLLEGCSYGQQGGTTPFPFLNIHAFSWCQDQLIFLPSCLQKCSLPGLSAIVSSKKWKTLAILGLQYLLLLVLLHHQHLGLHSCGFSLLGSELV